MLVLSVLDSATGLESAELLRHDDIRTPSPMSDPSLPPINDPAPLIAIPEPETKLTAPSISPIY